MNDSRTGVDHIPRQSSQRAEALKAGRGAERGFTLIELMVVVVVIAILASIAYPSYSRFVVKSRRATAAGCLMERAQEMERYYSTNLTYVGAPNPAACQDVSSFYALSFNGAVAARSYSLRAVPQGAQATKDAECGTLLVNEKGERTINGSGSDAMACW